MLGVYEEKMTRAGIHVESHVDVLAQQFWAQVPEEKKKAALESPDAWCVPPQKFREYVWSDCWPAGEKDAGRKYFAQLCHLHHQQNRRKSAARPPWDSRSWPRLYANAAMKSSSIDTIRQIGVQLAEERDSELQSVVGAAFVRLTQEATKKRAFPRCATSVGAGGLCGNPNGLASARTCVRGLRIENRLPEFIEEVIAQRRSPQRS